MSCLVLLLGVSVQEWLQASSLTLALHITYRSRS